MSQRPELDWSAENRSWQCNMTKRCTRNLHNTLGAHATVTESLLGTLSASLRICAAWGDSLRHVHRDRYSSMQQQERHVKVGSTN